MKIKLDENLPARLVPVLQRHGHLPHLKKRLYRHEKNVLGYGIKVWPEDFATLKTKAPEIISLEGLL